MKLLKSIRSRLGNLKADYIGPLYSGNNVLPGAVIIGAQKCGTTSLFHYLSQHPDVASPKTKEVHYFDKNYKKGLNWYRYNFSHADHPDGQLLNFESSPYYLFHPAVPSRLYSVMPDAKLIVMLRDPVRRAVSHYWHERNRGREELGFADALDTEKNRIGDDEEKLLSGSIDYSYNHHRHSYFSRGCYSVQIKRWLKLFPLNRFLFVESETFFESPDKSMKEILTFLDLKPFVGFEFKKQNVGKYDMQVDEDLLLGLKEAYTPYNQELPDLIDQNFRWTA